MNRSFWLILLLFFSATAVGAGWFAVNAPEASRPSFANLGAVRLAKENPPLPPAPLSRPRGKGYETVLRRPLFQSPGLAGSRQAVGASVALGQKAVGYREVLSPVAPSPALDFAEVVTPRLPRDDFQAAFGLKEPSHKQFFGGHLIDGASSATDGAPPAPGVDSGAGAESAPEFVSPTFAPAPRPRPEETAAAPPASAPAPKPEEPPRPGRAAVVSAATRFDDGGSAAISGGGAVSPEEDIVLLGVLLRRGEDRALIRLSSGESRRVSLGDTIAGWRVSSIKADSIQLKRASQTREIKVPD